MARRRKEAYAPLKTLPDAIQSLHNQHLDRVAEFVVSRDLEQMWISFDQLLETRVLMLRFEEPRDEMELQRLRGAIAEAQALRDALSTRIAFKVGQRKSGAEDPKEAIDNARSWLRSLSANEAGPIG